MAFVVLRYHYIIYVYIIYVTISISYIYLIINIYYRKKFFKSIDNIDIVSIFAVSLIIKIRDMNLRFLILMADPAILLGYSKVVDAIRFRLEPGENNYQVNYLVVHAVYDTAIDCETVCLNEYGSICGNEDRQIVQVSPRERATICRMLKTHRFK